MKQTCTWIAAVCLLAALLAGCTGQHDQNGHAGPLSETGQSAQITYSNLADAKTQEEVAAILLAHGVSQERVDTLMAWVDDCNKRVTTPVLPEGFVPMQGSYVDYADLMLTSKELPDGSFAPEPNCRLTSFLLLGDKIQTNGQKDESDTYLMFDIDGIDTQAQLQLPQQARTNFITLFNNVSVAGASTVSEHLEKIQQAWQDRAIQLDGSQGLSLISIYLHSPLEDVRFVGHTGVLVELEEGLLFLEKYSAEAPFQATRFHDRGELKTYLLSRPDLYGDGSELAPIVLENSSPLA